MKSIAIILVTMGLIGCAAKKPVRNPLDLQKDLGPVIQKKIDDGNYAKKSDLRSMERRITKKLFNYLHDYLPMK